MSRIEEEEDRPPAGMPCITCKMNAHFCQATRWLKDSITDGVCQPCFEGTECGFAAAKAKLNSLLIDPTPNSPAEVVELHSLLTSSYSDSTPNHNSTNIDFRATVGKQRRNIILPEIKQKIAEEPLVCTTYDLAKKYKVSYTTVWNIRHENQEKR